ncbi:glycosyltransferase family 4 protein [Roseivivax sp. CAU 1761]
MGRMLSRFTPISSQARIGSRIPTVIADFMRPFPGQTQAKSGMQNAISKNIFNWLSISLRRAFDTEPKNFVWDDGAQDSLPVRAVYETLDLDPSTVGWVKSYNMTPPPEAIEILRPYFEEAFVVGFEVSPFQKRIFDILKVPYVSLAIHPLRFMQDYKFMLETNYIDSKSLKPLHMPKDDKYFSAQMKAAETLKGYTSKLADNSAVLFGQVDVDAALISGDGLVSLQDCAAAIEEFCARFKSVYFKPHPYLHDSADQIRFLRRFPNVSVINENPYALLADPKVKGVGALTSSILSESPYFGKDPFPLAETWTNRASEPAYGMEILSPQFWNTLKEGVPSFEKSGVAHTTTLKSLLNISWENHGRTQVAATGLKFPINETLQFGSGGAADKFCVGGGWFPPAPDHHWTGPDNAFLSFRLPAGRTKSVDVTLSLSSMAAPNKPVTLQILCDRTVLKEHIFQSTQKVDLQFDIPAGLQSPTGEVLLELRCDAGHSPKETVQSEDRRALSLALYEMAVAAPVAAQMISVGDCIKIEPGCFNKSFMPFGWHKAETIGVWSDGRNSRLRIMMAHQTNEDIELRLGNVRAYLSEMLTANTLIVRADGKVLKKYRFEQNRPGDLQVGGVDLTIPIPRWALDNEQETATIDFEMLGCHSPQTAGMSADAREIGFMVESFTFGTAIQSLAALPDRHISNIFGPFNIHTGLAVMARNCHLALSAALSENAEWIRPRAINFNNSIHREGDTEFVEPSEYGSKVNIFVGDVTRIERIVKSNGSDIINNHYNICYGAWELETMPTYLADTRRIDEYWGLSNFIAEAARKRMDVPVHAFPIPVELHYPDMLTPRSRFGIPEDNFAFLFTFSVDSTMARKNPEAVLRAFQIAFPDRGKPVSMVFKSMIRQASRENRDAFERFKVKARLDPRVVIIEETLSDDENASLYMRCDAYVSLHRAEGFGLTMAEAMGYGKPTIGTGYSGNLDFMNDENSCLVRFDRVLMSPDAYHQQETIWAEPDARDAARHMRRVHEDIVFREKIARQGKRTIQEQFSRQAVGRKLLQRIQEIRGGLQ